MSKTIREVVAVATSSVEQSLQPLFKKVMIGVSRYHWDLKLRRLSLLPMNHHHLELESKCQWKWWYRMTWSRARSLTTWLKVRFEGLLVHTSKASWLTISTSALLRKSSAWPSSKWFKSLSTQFISLRKIRYQPLTWFLTMYWESRSKKSLMALSQSRLKRVNNLIEDSEQSRLNSVRIHHLLEHKWYQRSLHRKEIRWETLKKWIHIRID